MLWGHPTTSTVPTRNIMGQGEAISSSIYKCSGRILVHQQCLPEIYWAKTKQSAAASANTIGPSECVGSASQKYIGPKQSNRQQHQLIQWAHPKTLAETSRTKVSQIIATATNTR